MRDRCWGLSGANGVRDLGMVGAGEDNWVDYMLIFF